MRGNEGTRGHILHLCDIARAIVAGYNNKTGIQYTANLSYEMTIKYLNEMIKLALIQQKRKDGVGTVYSLTRKGHLFLETLTKLEVIAGPPKPRGFYAKAAEKLKSREREAEKEKEKQDGKESNE